MDTKIKKELDLVLKSFDDKYYIDGVIAKNKVIEAISSYDEDLLTAMLSNETIRKHYSKEISDYTIIETDKLIETFEMDDYWMDSLTKYSKKIGLTTGGRFIDEMSEVVLDFPYKDTVLLAGMTKEDVAKDELKPDEPFYNEVISAEEIDVMLDKKILVNAKRYTKDGVEDVASFDENDNLIIKGNNLLVLSSLLEKYEGKVKLIYIDPPYNTGGDANIFSYNNTFNHSTWLTFMKNRLTLSKMLLRDDGFLAVSIDHVELFYLGSLCDEIFGRENRISIITVQHNPKGRNQAEFFSENSEFMLVYAKNKKNAKFNNVAIDDDVKATFTEKDDNGLYRWEPYIRARSSWSRKHRPKNWYPIYIKSDGSEITSTKKENFTPIFPQTPQGDFSWKNIKSTFDSLNKNNYFKVEKINNKFVLYHKYYEQQVFKNVWIDKKYQSEFNGTNVLKKLIGKTNFSYPKSIYTIGDIIKITTKDNDIILDFFGGSGTTAHSIMMTNKEQNMRRKYILVEQLDEHIEIMLKRLNTLVSLDNMNQHFFVYAELMEKSRGYIDSIQEAKTEEELQEIYKLMLDNVSMDFKADLEELEEALKKLDLLNDKKSLLLQVIDKNNLYYNYSEIDDEKVRDLISDTDYKFNKSFYEGVDENVKE